jgi:hypothetical protein
VITDGTAHRSFIEKRDHETSPFYFIWTIVFPQPFEAWSTNSPKLSSIASVMRNMVSNDGMRISRSMQLIVCFAKPERPGNFTLMLQHSSRVAIPREMWSKAKAFQDAQFVSFLESHFKDVRENFPRS